MSTVLDLGHDDARWEHEARRVLARWHRRGRRLDVLHGQLAAAAALRRAIRVHEECTRAAFPELARDPRGSPRDALRLALAAVVRAGAARGSSPEIAVPIAADLEEGEPSSEPPLPEADDVWRGLYAGTWSVVDHFELDGRRHFFLFETDTGELDPLRLTPLQRGALAELSRGLSDAEIAAQLHIKLDAASALVRAVKRKLRMPHRKDLIGLNADCLRVRRLQSSGLCCALLYSTNPLSEVIPQTLSVAERNILRLQSEGKSNSEIAQIRQVAYKTVTNQVAAAYAKLNVRTCGQMLHSLRAACR
jgi:DNA-binding CsgD family transcriptional regulator